MDTTTFTAVCQRAGRWWTVRVLQIEGLTAQVKNLDQAEMMTRQSIARVLGIPAEVIKVEVRTETSDPVAQARNAREAARQAAETAAAATRAAVDALVRDGCTLRDAAVLIGLTPGEMAEFTPRSLPA
jgi:hypothetical protein